MFREFTGVFSAFISFSRVVIWYSFDCNLSDFRSGFSCFCHFFNDCFFLGAVVSSTSNCLDGDLELWDVDLCRLCLGPLLCFERDLLDDEGVSVAGGGGVFGLSADDCLDLSGELPWREDSREGRLDEC